jgi:hypothetical protein
VTWVERRDGVAQMQRRTTNQQVFERDHLCPERTAQRRNRLQDTHEVLRFEVVSWSILDLFDEDRGVRIVFH